jgi:uncharacterized protein YbdZ (MbtH family)
MNRDHQDDAMIYKVVINHEEQYSIWPVERDNPLGWKDAGKSGPKDECLASIKEVWTDMRPLSLRKKMEEMAKNPPPAPPVQSAPVKNDLVQRLSTGEHPVEVTLRPERTTQALKECIERGYVHIKFTNTQGGTELGVRLDKNASDFGKADFAGQRGNVRLIGGLTLDYVPVRCIADIDLSTLSGKGHLERVGAA